MFTSFIGRLNTDNLGIKIKILLAFFCLSFLTYCFPVLIMQATSYYGVDHGTAGALESYFNLTNMVVTLAIFSVFLRFGYRRPMIVVFLIMVVVCFFAKVVDSIWMVRAYLIATGISFVVIKVSCYSMVGMIIKTREGHARFVNFMEFIHMVSNMLAMWTYAWFVKGEGAFWLYLFWFIAGIFVVLSLIFLFTRIDESSFQHEQQRPFGQQLRDIGRLITTTAIILPLLMYWGYESIEQGVGPWLSTFNFEILQVPKHISVQLHSMFVLAIALGRLYGSFIYKWLKWQYVFLINFGLGLLFICFVLFNMQPGAGAGAQSLLDLPLVAYCLPAFGFFIGPVYPTLISLILTSHPQSLHPAIMCLIMIVGALLDSFSARMVGGLFSHFGGVTAFEIYTIVPLIVLIVLTIPYALFLRRRAGREVSGSA
ncbi:MAG: MFS transporter [Negativicutes bacterium]|nr:MFS transporter [Negativicutes bacterium]